MSGLIESTSPEILEPSGRVGSPSATSDRSDWRRLRSTTPTESSAIVLTSRNVAANHSWTNRVQFLEYIKPYRYLIPLHPPGAPTVAAQRSVRPPYLENFLCQTALLPRERQAHEFEISKKLPKRHGRKQAVMAPGHSFTAWRLKETSPDPSFSRRSQPLCT